MTQIIYPKVLYRAYADRDPLIFNWDTEEIDNPEEGQVFYEEYRVTRHTPKGCYVNIYSDQEKWVSLTNLGRFAYPTKREALVNLVMRRRLWLKRLKDQIDRCQGELDVAERQLGKYMPTHLQ